MSTATPPKMNLTAQQQDVLNELINIGFGRAASSLSMLVNQRILLNVPQIEICPLTEIQTSLEELGGQELVTVQQVFRGKLTGNAMLLLEAGEASMLVDLMNGGAGSPGPITHGSQEALSEVGNIVISAFLGAFGNLLRIHLAFTVPYLKVETLVHMIQTLMASDEKNKFAMVVKIRFQLAQQHITGFLILVMGANTLESLLGAIKKEGMLL